MDFFKKYKIWILSAAGVLLVSALTIMLIFVLPKDEEEVASNDISSSDVSSAKTPSDESPLQSETPEESEVQEPTEQPEPPEPVVPLVISSPTQQDVTVSQSHFAITGTSDPAKPLVMNGNAVERLDGGEFTIDVELSPGSNTFVFEYDGQSTSYIIRYSFTVISAYAPYEKQSYEAGSSFVVVACARVNSSSVTATFNGKTINLTPQPYKEGEEFTNFTGTFTLPTGNESDLNLGGVKFTGVCQGVSKSYNSPNIICLRDKALDKTQIVEIVVSQAETFNGNTTDDWSRPTNSYLPEGTVDYKVGGIVYEAESGNSYYNLRCGKRVYITKKNAPDTQRVTVSKVYPGELPDYNNISFVQGEVDDKHTLLTFDTEWKAPFAVEVGPQNYKNPSKQDYNISGVTYSYVDIKFYYATTISGEIVFIDHPLFSSADVIRHDDGYILRLHLNSVGAFYGWNAEYNEQGQLVFEFLNPPVITEKNNLTGIKIVIDAGHGGKDVGATGLRPNTNPEAERNLALAYKLKAQLEAYGATVIMTRQNDTTMSSDARCEFLREQAPDLCISVHHDSLANATANGGSILCFTPFSDKVMNCVYDNTLKQGFYKTLKKGWHYFYMARVTSCPVVLTENGFISNQDDFSGIISEQTNVQKAKAITQGVLDYFNSFYKTVANDDDLNYNGQDNNVNGTIPPVEDEIPPIEEEIPTIE